MRRRSFLKSTLVGAATLATPQIGRTEAQKTLTFVPHADLASLDPVWTTADISRNFALAVHDKLYGYDTEFNAQPQMVEGHAIENDGLQWDLLLRDGLTFHDGSPVRALDCVATITRGAKRYPMGQALMDRTDELAAISDKTRAETGLPAGRALPYYPPSQFDNRGGQNGSGRQEDGAAHDPLRDLCADRG
jgi:peptide/nickel transport system substrate-binding protein